ncbi:hypothetical protein ABID16_000040 [Rhizobium aquaticum]|uniref:Tip attachment protein J HDII-ins2 domain-containing protein n=1 Tax=Rhizobium aquaticum TaxID=1549636 RepID=A0ABV2IVD7_9HYPH
MKLENLSQVEIIEPGAGVDVWLRRSPLRTEREHFIAPVGLTLAEIVELARDLHGLHISRAMYVTISGHPVERSRWHRVRVKPGATVNIVVIPGQNAFRAILGVVVSIAAVFLAPILAAPIISILGVGGTVIATAITGAIGVGLSVAGSLAINALFPVSNSAPTNSLGQSDSTRTLYSIAGGQNSAQRYGAIPVIFGTHRISPPYGAREYTEISGDDQYLRMLFVIGYGTIDVSDIKIGETPISKFEGAQVEIITDSTSQALTLYTAPVYEESVSVLLQSTDDWTVRTTADKIETISVDFSFPNGVYRYQKSDGNRVNYAVTVEVQYAAKSSGAWVSAGTVSIASSSPQAVRRTLAWSVASGQYDVRVRKITADYSGSDTVSESVYWIAVRGRRPVKPVNFPKKLTLLDLKIQATNSLSGTVDKLNMIAKPRMKAWNGATWVDDQNTRNPADNFRYVLQGDANARPVPDSMIDLQSIQDWHAYNVANGFVFDYVTTEAKSVYDTLTMIAAAGRAAVSIRDGKWGVVWDVENSPIVQHFSPRNSWGFQSARAYADLPHGFRVSFINAKNGYQLDERVVYDDGYSVGNATKLEGINFEGQTEPDLIWRHGRYHIAQLRLQREVHSLYADFEHLVCTRGDRVRVNHDTVLWGAGSARVKWVSAAPDVVTIDDTFIMEAGKTYSMRFRLVDGSSIVRTIVGVAGGFRTFNLAGSGALPEADDLVLFGENTLESVVLRVKSVTAQADLTAKIELVDDAPAIMQADKGAIPAFSTGIAGPIDYGAVAPANLSVVESVWSTSPASSALTISWTMSDVATVLRFYLQYAPRGSDQWSSAITTTTHQATVTDVAVGSYDIRVRAIFSNGQVSGWLFGNATASIFAGAPGDVSNFRISVTGDNSILQWDQTQDEITGYYEIRYSSLRAGVSWQTATVLVTNVTGGQVQIGTMAGTYLIKAVSVAGIPSENAALIVSDVTSVTAFNAVETVVDTAFVGAKTNTSFDGETLRLTVQGDFFGDADFFDGTDFFLGDGGYFATGYYDLDNTIDLGDTYTVRISAQIDGGGVQSSVDFFGDGDFFDGSDFFGDVANKWDVSIEVALTQDNPAGVATWSDWVPLTISHVAGRAFKFRAKLISGQSDVTPVVSSLVIVVDMPDRIVAGNDLPVGTGGAAITFNPPFKALQGLGIAAQDLRTGEYAEISGKSESGFSIIIKDATGSPVVRTFDYVAKGYGAVH